MPDYQKRMERATALMKGYGLDVMLLTKPANMFYLTGDGRLCAYAMVTRDGKIALGVPQTDVEDVKSNAWFDRIVGFKNEIGMVHSIADYFEYLGIKEGTLGLEYAFLPEPRMGMLIHPHAKPKAVGPVDCTPLMSELRLVKDDEEIDCIRSAAKAAEEGLSAALSTVKRGITENQIAAEAEYAMRQAGAVDFYRTYVSSGPRTNIAHGLPTLRALKDGDLVMIDVHPVVNGYAADLCRTVCVGKPSAEQKAAYDLYVEAMETTIRKVKAGVGMVELEQTMHNVFEANGHGQHIFGPPIHGVGIEFEESPLPSGHAFFHGEKEPAPLAANVVIAIGNCGLYTGLWGVRDEDTLVVGTDGPIVLTGFPRQLENPL
ncbi:MAG: M24 family metallopeptidase [Syntrophobacteraceae bacterium]